MSITQERYLGIEAPDTRAVVNFLGKYAVQVKLTLDDGSLRVEVQGCDDRASILMDEVLEVPEADDRS